MKLAQGTNEETATSLAQMHGRFLGFLRKRLGDPEAAEDILQSAYLKALKHGGELRDPESSVAWFYRILRNAIVDHYRRAAVRLRMIEQFTADWKEASEPELKEETCACIREVIRDLRPEYRAAIEGVDLGGQSIESFALAQNMTANNAYVRLHRARKAVAKKLIEVCGTCVAHGCLDCTCRRNAS